MYFSKYMIITLTIILSLYGVSCNSTSTGGTSVGCSTLNPDGDCPNDKTCIMGSCYSQGEVCSKEVPKGLCQEGYICYNGKCEETGELPCAPEYPNGKCEEENKSCLDGVCTNDTELCSISNKTGKCAKDKICIDGECMDTANACSQENQTGLCQDSKVCIDGSCKEESELCSADNPAGLCKKDEICSSGMCVERTCDDNQRRNCYPGEQTELNKGICRSGVQLCKNSIWGECKGAITPQNEKCDEIDNDCDGEIDENVKNICGDCRAESSLPSEIPNNNIDDDCDGLIDEDGNNSGGMESCEGRMNQPCYTGPIGTNGKGICKGGLRDCQWGEDLNQWTVWGACIGQKLPEVEICDNIDNNCNGVVDENCQTAECLDEEICGNNRDDDCNNLIDDTCSIDVVRTECAEEEVCHNGFDDNCDGVVDEGCSCNNLTELECFSSDPSMVNHGETTQCQTGIMYCIGGESWGSCDNQILPSVEICDGIDNDCDGIVDNNAIDGNACGVCNAQPAIEICGNDIDDNCDGFVNENCPTDNCDNPSEEVCDGIDNDCDGLTDEGVLNSCGKCDDSCYEINIGNDNAECNESSDDYPSCLNDVDEDFDNGELDGIGVDPDNPNNLTLDSSTIQNDYIWIANSGDTPTGSLTKINTKTGLVEGPFPVGLNPSRTAVERDGSVWVANRDSHNVTKLNADGSFAFNVNLHAECAPRGLALDRNGNAWVGCYALRGSMGTADGYVYKISPTGTIFDGYPFSSSVPIYGLAIDSRGYLWSSRLSDHYAGAAARTMLKIDTNKNPGDNKFFKSFSFDNNFQSYGLVIDSEDNIWFAGWADSGVKKVTYNEGSDTISIVTYPSSNDPLRNQVNGSTRGIAVDSQGNIWTAISSSPGKVVKFNSSGAVLDVFTSNGNAPIGIGVDSEDEVWVINRNSASNQAVELRQNGSQKGSYTTGSAPYSYSDLTGFNLRNIVSPSGSFKTIIDTEREQASYDSISWTGNTPNGSSIKVRARVSNNRNNFLLPETNPSSPEWSNFVTTSGEALTWPSGISPIGRYIQIEVIMSIGATSEDKPSLSNIQINWQRP